MSLPSFVRQRFVGVWLSPYIPDFGRFLPSRAYGLRAAKWPCSPKNLPHRSREYEFTDGRVLRVKDACPLHEYNTG